MEGRADLFSILLPHGVDINMNTDKGEKNWRISVSYNFTNMSFKNKYQVIRGAISKEVADIAYRYLQISAEADHWMLNNGVTHTGNKLVGNFNDSQVPGSYAKYGDRLMETLLVKTIAVMQKKTELKLVPTYSYTRLYRKGNILRDKDRPSQRYRLH